MSLLTTLDVKIQDNKYLLVNKKKYMKGFLRTLRSEGITKKKSKRSLNKSAYSFPDPYKLKGATARQLKNVYQIQEASIKD
jgi:hypothetical protein